MELVMDRTEQTHHPTVRVVILCRHISISPLRRNLMVNAPHARASCAWCSAPRGRDDADDAPASFLRRYLRATCMYVDLVGAVEKTHFTRLHAHPAAADAPLHRPLRPPPLSISTLMPRPCLAAESNGVRRPQLAACPNLARMPSSRAVASCPVSPHAASLDLGPPGFGPVRRTHSDSPTSSIPCASCVGAPAPLSSRDCRLPTHARASDARTTTPTPSRAPARASAGLAAAPSKAEELLRSAPKDLPEQLSSTPWE
ncbi:hypothetical protein B0H13DRAFT_2306657 [Mycena leptocephala]|nr:hypothetical protein B0H13DRAFT_2306657 [Mycena leptocephala]